MMLTIHDAAARYRVCTSCLPEVDYLNRTHGVIDGFGVAHFADRRFTRRALRNMLLLVARRDREADGGFLNNSGLFDYLYLYLDNTTASRMATDLGVRLPARLSRLDRLQCLRLARRRGVRLSKRSALYAWAHADV